MVTAALVPLVAGLVLMALALVGSLITIWTDSPRMGAVTLLVCFAAIGCILQAEAVLPPHPSPPTSERDHGPRR